MWLLGLTYTTFKTIISAKTGVRKKQKNKNTHHDFSQSVNESSSFKSHLCGEATTRWTWRQSLPDAPSFVDWSRAPVLGMQPLIPSYEHKNKLSPSWAKLYRLCCWYPLLQKWRAAFHTKGILCVYVCVSKTFNQNPFCWIFSRNRMIWRSTAREE